MRSLYDTCMRSRKEHEHQICKYNDYIYESERLRIIAGAVSDNTDKVSKTISRNYCQHKSNLYAEEINKNEIKMFDS